MQCVTLKSDKFVDQIGQPTLREIKQDMIQTFKNSTKKNDTKCINVKKSLMDSILNMDFNCSQRTLL